MTWGKRKRKKKELRLIEVDIEIEEDSDTIECEPGENINESVRKHVLNNMLRYYITDRREVYDE